MSKHFRTYAGRISAWLMTAASHTTGSVRYGWEARWYQYDHWSMSPWKCVVYSVSFHLSMHRLHMKLACTVIQLPSFPELRCHCRRVPDMRIPGHG